MHLCYNDTMKTEKRETSGRRRAGKASAANLVERLQAAFAVLRKQEEQGARKRARIETFGYPGWVATLLAELKSRTADLRQGLLGDCQPLVRTPRSILQRLLALSPYARFHRWELDEAALVCDEGAHAAAAFDFRNPGSKGNLSRRVTLDKGTAVRVLMPECTGYADFVQTFDQYVLLLAICAKTAACPDAATIFLDALFRFRDGVKSFAGCLSAEEAEKVVTDIERGLRTLRVSIAYAQLPDLGEYAGGKE